MIKRNPIEIIEFPIEDQNPKGVRYVPSWTVMMAVKGSWRLKPQGQEPKNLIHQYGSLSENIGKAVNQNIKHDKSANDIEDMWVFNMTD